MSNNVHIKYNLNFNLRIYNKIINHSTFILLLSIIKQFMSANYFIFNNDLIKKIKRITVLSIKNIIFIRLPLYNQ